MSWLSSDNRQCLKKKQIMGINVEKIAKSIEVRLNIEDKNERDLEVRTLIEAIYESGKIDARNEMIQDLSKKNNC